MKKLIRKIFYSNNFKRAMIHAAFTNPRLTSAEYLALSKELRALNNIDNQEMQSKKGTEIKMKKAS